jgi:hypothetical protein
MKAVIKRNSFLISLILMSASIAYALNIGHQQDKKVTITVTLQEADILLKGLGKLPLEESGNLFFTVQRQIQTQLQPQKPDTNATNSRRGPSKN